MKFIRPFYIVFIFTIALASLILSGCGDTKVSHVTVRLGNSTAKNTIIDWFFPSAHADVEQFKMCFKGLRFKLMDEDSNSNGNGDGDGDSDSADNNVDFDPGLVTVTDTGRTLGEFDLPEGTYRRVDVKLRDECGTGYSVQVTNDFGTFQTSHPVTLKFDGIFEADDADEFLELVVEEFFDRLDLVQSEQDLLDALVIRARFN